MAKQALIMTVTQILIDWNEDIDYTELEPETYRPAEHTIITAAFTNPPANWKDEICFWNSDAGEFVQILGCPGDCIYEHIVEEATDELNAPIVILGGKRYVLELAIVPGNATTSQVKLYINGDTTDANYTKENTDDDGGSWNTARSALPTVITVTHSTSEVACYVKMEIWAELGYVFCMATGVRGRSATTMAIFDQYFWNHATTINSINAIKVKASVADTFDVGTVFSLKLG